MSGSFVFSPISELRLFSHITEIPHPLPLNSYTYTCTKNITDLPGSGLFLKFLVITFMVD